MTNIFETTVKKLVHRDFSTPGHTDRLRAVIPNLGYVYPQGYEPGYLRASEKK